MGAIKTVGTIKTVDTIINKKRGYNKNRGYNNFIMQSDDIYQPILVNWFLWVTEYLQTLSFIKGTRCRLYSNGIKRSSIKDVTSVFFGEIIIFFH